MNTGIKKVILEVYGLLRMTLGAAQIVGLTAGYFFYEWIVHFPPQAKLYVLDQDIVILTYLAVFLRGIFHVIAGIGIARVQKWARNWLLYGWSITLIITIGLAYTIYHEWSIAGFVGGFSQVISFYKLLLYAAVVVFDFVFIKNAITQLHQDRDFKENMKTIEVKKVASLFFIVVLFFSLLLYLGKPVKQGFHKGYYKSKGQRSSALQQVKVSGGEDNAQSKMLAPKESASGDRKVNEGLRDALGLTAGGSVQGIPYRTLIGFMAGICVILAFLFQAFEISHLKNTRNISLSCYVFLCVGFFLWIVYGISSRIMVVSLTGFASFILCVTIVLMKLKYGE